MKLIDTFDAIKRLGAAVGRDPGQLLPLWEAYIESYGGELKGKLKKDSAGYDFEREVRPILLSALTEKFPAVEQAHESLLACFADVTRRFEISFGSSDGVEVWFYLGLCSGAGWATSLSGRDAVLLGAEKIAELSWGGQETLRSLLCHELCHVAHFRFRRRVTERADDKNRDPVWHLYAEGFATRFEQLLSGRDGGYRQDRDGWLSWCRENHRRLCAEYLARMRTGRSCGDFFGDWNRMFGRSDTGYYLGCEFIRTLQESLTAEQIARMPLGEAEQRLDEYLRRESERGDLI